MTSSTTAACGRPSRVAVILHWNVNIEDLIEVILNWE
jgi:hypothetical protein